MQDGVKLNLDSDKRMAIERVVAKLHVAPNPNSKVSNDEIDAVIDTFWEEFGHFQKQKWSLWFVSRKISSPRCTEW